MAKSGGKRERPGGEGEMLDVCSREEEIATDKSRSGFIVWNGILIDGDCFPGNSSNKLTLQTWIKTSRIPRKTTIRMTRGIFANFDAYRQLSVELSPFSLFLPLSKGLE